jgi:hypothetical protein
MRVTAFLTLLFLSGCGGMKNSSSEHAEPIVVNECAGFLSVTLNLQSAPPSNVRIVWNGDKQVNECAAQNQGQLDRGSSWIRYSEGSFGYTAPSKISLEVYDLGDCSSGETLLFSVMNAAVSDHQPQLCESFNLKFNE